jgi:peptidoglycan/xylan/chitin deacetylase (PgdA/CDA1 family)
MKIYYDHNIIEDELTPPQLLKINKHLTSRVTSFESFLQEINNKPKLNPRKDDILKHSHEKNKILLTFDDGYKSFKRNVLPLLEKYKTPCILFITTDFIERADISHEVELLEIVQKNNNIIDTEKNKRNIENLNQKKSIYKELHYRLKNTNKNNKERELCKLKKYNNFNGEISKIFEYLSWEDVIEIDKHPLVTIGSHTKSHTNLKKAILSECYKEILDSKKKIEEKIEHSVEFFSYPYGANSFLARLLARWSGYKCAFTTKEEGYLKHNRFNIPRIEINNYEK